MRIKFTVREREEAAKMILSSEEIFYVTCDPRELNHYGDLTLVAEYVYNYKKYTLSENFWAENLDKVKKEMVERIKNEIEEKERKDELLGYMSVEEI